MNEQRNPRAFIDMNGGYQSTREGIDKEAHDAWVKSNTWDLTRDDFIRLSYFHGNLEHGDDGRPSESHPINGSTFKPHDVVYVSETGGGLTRSMVSSWLEDCSSFTRGYKTAAIARALPQGAPDA
jgi:hypothetical protein